MKKTALSLILLSTTLLAQSALAADKTVTCKASGKNLSNNGSSAPLTVIAQFTFTDSLDTATGLRVLKNIRGSVVTSPEAAKEDYSSYIGKFSTPSLTEAPNYRPNKYKGYSKFDKLEAVDTTGSAEDGMWGSLVVEKNTSQAKFQAHYIFQAGDHMGGTIHLTCSAR